MQKVIKWLGLGLMSLVIGLSLASCAGEAGSQGETGPQGPQGETGPQGPQGDAGNDGVDGLSSYEIYTKYNWYRGTEEDWISDLVDGTLANMPYQYPVNLASDGKSFTYGKVGEEKTVEISDKSIYLDGSLSDEEIEGKANVYNNFNEALAAAKDGTASEPTSIYIAPWVYWIHDPNSKETTDPFGIYADVDYLNLIGLTDNPENVVIAGNYGHDEGFAGGNWTMFNFTGDGLTLKNIRFGGYCNIDLEYDLNPDLNVEKRTTNITQCQIASLNGDKLYAENCDFISRLNMMPFNNSERALYVDCHFESTDDSLNGSSQSVYLNCDFDFYASKPWYSSNGSTLLNSDINIVHLNHVDGTPVEQYLSKAPSFFTLVDVRYHADYEDPVYVGYNDILPDTFRGQYANVTLNGEAIKMDNGGKTPDAGVDISNTEVLKAYKLTTEDGTVIYNVYNLLRGSDDWDPLNQKEIVTKLNASDLPRRMNAFVDANGRPQTATIESGKDTVSLGFEIIGQQDTDYNSLVTATWSVPEEYQEYVKLTPSADTLSCVVEGTNTTEEAVTIILTVTTNTGFEGAIELVVKPSILPAPTVKDETVSISQTGSIANITYELEGLDGRDDMSQIVWYVCDDEKGTNPIQIAYGRDDEPLKEIALSKAYVGKYLMAVIRGKHIRSDYGEEQTFMATAPIVTEGIEDSKVIEVNTHIFPTVRQDKVLEGFWTVDLYKPLDTAEEGNEFYSKNTVDPDDVNSGLAYGTGNKNGFLDKTGLYQTAYGSRLMYTPIEGTYGDMEATIVVAPGKTAGQGFGSANQYMDILINVDTTTLTGYGVRIYRHTGDSCKIALISLKDGKSELISESVVTSAYLTDCTIKVWTEGNKLSASITTTAPNPGTGYEHEVNLSADITANTFGGFYLQHAGTVGDNATYITGLTITYK